MDGCALAVLQVRDGGAEKMLGVHMFSANYPHNRHPRAKNRHPREGEDDVVVAVMNGLRPATWPALRPKYPGRQNR
jgi:hypothetical protein